MAEVSYDEASWAARLVEDRETDAAVIADSAGSAASYTTDSDRN